MEQNMAGYAKYYYCGSIELSGSSEFIREIDHNRRDFSTDVRNKLYFELGTIT
jgi:hypothetical protein